MFAPLVYEGGSRLRTKSSVQSDRGGRKFDDGALYFHREVNPENAELFVKPLFA
jgi:hypothetical protein